MSWKSKTNSVPRTVPSKTSRYLIFDPRHHKINVVLVALVRFFLVLLWTMAIGFGATSLFVAIDERSLFSYKIEADTQLAFLGFFNKIMDVLVLTTLRDLSHVLVLVWMLTGLGSRRYGIVSRGTGARLRDFEMFEELSKPWRSASAFWTRCRARGWTWNGFGRFVLTFTVSMCVLLQGVAINTIGIPKERWYPDEEYMFQSTLVHPSAQIQSIDVTAGSRDFDIVGEGRHSWVLAGAFSAANTYVNLQDLVPQFGDVNRNWSRVGTQELGYVTLDTRYSGTKGSMHGFAVKSDIAQEIFYWAQAHGPPRARVMIGWMTHLKIIVPTVAVTCAEASMNAEALMLYDETVVVDKVGTNTSSFKLLMRSTWLDDQTNASFPSVQCSITISRAIYPFYTYGGSNNPLDFWCDDTINKKDYFDETAADIHLSPAPIDTYLADQVRMQLVFITSHFEHFIPEMTAAQLLGRNARRLRKVRPDISTDASAVAPAVALMAVTVLAYSSWAWKLDTNFMLTSSPARYQLLGSGPRLRWEWLAAIVLLVLTLVTLAGLILSVMFRFAAPDFLTPSGMLVAANSSGPLSVFKTSSGNVHCDREIEGQRFYLRQINDGGGNDQGQEQTSRVSIVQDRHQGSKVNMKDKLKWA